MISVSAVRGYMTPERAAVSALFFTNGYIVGNWAPKIPGFKAALGIDEAVLGLLILAFGLGSLAVMPLVGAVITREGSRRICRLTALALTPVLLLVTLVPNVWAAALVLALLGGVVGGMDVAMNANAVAVERFMRRAIMSSCHAWWSSAALWERPPAGCSSAVSDRSDTQVWSGLSRSRSSLRQAPPFSRTRRPGKAPRHGLAGMPRRPPGAGRSAIGCCCRFSSGWSRSSA